MASKGYSVAIFVVVVLLKTAVVWAQDPPPLNDDDDTKIRADFLVPESQNEMTDKFTKNSREYLFINFKLPYSIAQIICEHQYMGRLAWVVDLTVANFLAEALSETNLMFDSLWTAGVKQDNHWVWQHGNKTQFLGEEIEKLIVESQHVKTEDRNCLGFSRADHDIPQLRPLACQAERAIVCEREFGGISDNGSTHAGWIKLDNDLYKIFQQRVTYDEAKVQCTRYDARSTLAVVRSYLHSQQLGRYLLIGRPSLENAWIGARFIGSNYQFEPEDIILANRSDDSGYPPWRNGIMSKRNGCVLLDRHLSNITLFVEARCERLRPFICHKKEAGREDGINKTDIIIDDFGYRLVYNKMNWDDANETCTVKWGAWGAKLPEIVTTEKTVVYHLLYVMGENKTAVQHIWLGAKLESTAAAWKWSQSGTVIPQDGPPMDWIRNTTYTDEVEAGNVCLNMDRENHIQALHYGTVCNAHQSFVCMFSKEKLLELIEIEKTEKPKGNAEPAPKPAPAPEPAP